MAENVARLGNHVIEGRGMERALHVGACLARASIMSLCWS